MGRDDWSVRGFLGTRMLMETRHTGKASMNAEVAVWMERARRCEATHIEIVNLSSGAKETVAWTLR